MVSKGVKKLFGKSKKSKKTKPVAETPAPAAPAPEPEPVAVPEEEVRDEAVPAVEEKASKDETTDNAEKETEAKEEVAVAKSKSGDASDDAVAEVAKSESADGSKDGAEEEEVKEEDDPEELKFKRINTLHAEVTVPLNANSGDVLDIEHDGSKQIKVPHGQQGQNIVVKMVNSQSTSDQDTGPFCGCL